jgi:hypothetical protein
MPLVISNKQMEAIGQSQTDDFIERVTAELRTDHAEDVEYYTDEELYDEISEGIERAESYGLEGDADVAAFVKLLLTIGWYFDRYPMFQEILTEESYTHDEKMPAIFETAADEDWEAAADYSDKELEAMQN